VLTPLSGLQRALVSGTELMRSLGEPLLNQAATVLGEHLPITDVAQAILERGDAAKGKGKRGEKAQLELGDSCLLPSPFCLDAAAPLVRSDAAPEPKGREGDSPREPATADFLLIPASEAGKLYGEQAKRGAPTLHLVTVPGQADLMYCREQKFLSVEDVQRLLGPCRAAYGEAAVTPLASPHSRCDICDWVPLDP
jgi:hypothetical protein